jgi:hypothetical protein
MYDVYPVGMCQTKFLGPTDHRGSRVKATHLKTKESVTLPWIHELDSADNHARAARVLFNGMAKAGVAWRMLACSRDGGGYIFSLVPDNL